MTSKSNRPHQVNEFKEIVDPAEREVPSLYLKSEAHRGVARAMGSEGNTVDLGVIWRDLEVAVKKYLSAMAPTGQVRDPDFLGSQSHQPHRGLHRNNKHHRRELMERRSLVLEAERPLEITEDSGLQRTP